MKAIFVFMKSVIHKFLLLIFSTFLYFLLPLLFFHRFLYKFHLLSTTIFQNYGKSESVENNTQLRYRCNLTYRVTNFLSLECFILSPKMLPDLYLVALAVMTS